jgi:hypothetical protein
MKFGEEKYSHLRYGSGVLRTGQNESFQSSDFDERLIDVELQSSNTLRVVATLREKLLRLRNLAIAFSPHFTRR